MKEKISKLTKKELVQLVITLSWYRPFDLRKGDILWAKWLTERERILRLVAQREKIKDTTSEDYKQIKKEIKGSLARRDKLYAQYEAQRRSEYEAQRRSEQADESEVAK